MQKIYQYSGSYGQSQAIILYMTLRTDRNGDLFGRLVTEEKVNELYEGAIEDMHNKNIIASPYRLLPVGSFLLGVEEPYRIFVHESEMSSRTTSRTRCNSAYY